MDKQKIIGASILVLVMILIGFIYPITTALGNEEIRNPEYSFNLFLFSIILVVSTLGIIGAYFLFRLLKKDDYLGSSFGFFNIGEKPALKIFGRFKPFQLVLWVQIIWVQMVLPHPNFYQQLNNLHQYNQYYFQQL